MSRENDKKRVKIAFLCSLILHVFLIGAADFNLAENIEDDLSEDLSVTIQIEKPPLLPQVEAPSQEKKLKEVIEKKKATFKVETDKPETVKPQPAEDLAFYDNSIFEKSLDEQLIPDKSKKEDTGKKENIQDLEKIEVSDPDQEELLRYQDMVKQRIEANRRYPRWAYRNNLEGIVYLSFEVLSDGSVKNLKIVDSSGVNILDKGALCTVRRAAPFPPIPADFEVLSLKMDVAIVFRVNKN